MPRFVWNGPGNCRGALPGEEVEITADLAAYLREEVGAECLADVEPPQPAPKPKTKTTRRKSRSKPKPDSEG